MIIEGQFKEGISLAKDVLSKIKTLEDASICVTVVLFSSALLLCLRFCNVTIDGLIFSFVLSAVAWGSIRWLLWREQAKIKKYLQKLPPGEKRVLKKALKENTQVISIAFKNNNPELYASLSEKGIWKKITRQKTEYLFIHDWAWREINAHPDLLQLENWRNL